MEVNEEAVTREHGNAYDHVVANANIDYLDEGEEKLQVGIHLRG